MRARHSHGWRPYSTARMLSASVKARVILFILFGGLCAAVVGAPFFAAASQAKSASFLYLSFSTICHQDSERSFHLFGNPLAVCHRCSGIYFGLFLTLLLPPRCYRVVHESNVVRKWWALVASIPLVIDGTIGFFEIWSGSTFVRFATGLLFGAMLMTLLVQGITEIVRNHPRQQEAATEGGTS